MAKKRGRKRKNDLYFGPEQEEAVIKFISIGTLVPHPDYPDDEKNPMVWEGSQAEAIERNAIYDTWLREPFDKMIESIIRRYKLYRKGYTFEDLHGDTLSFLIMKSSKFKAEKGKKAYSYYGTICKNYILGLLMKDEKTTKQNYSFEESQSTIEQRTDMQYELEDTSYQLMHFIKDISEEIKREMVEANVSKKKLTINEEKVGAALIDILDNWELIYDNLEGGAKFNKNVILETMRNYTGLSTKDIRVAMRRYKKLYGLVKEDKIDNGYL